MPIHRMRRHGPGEGIPHRVWAVIPLACLLVVLGGCTSSVAQPAPDSLTSAARAETAHVVILADTPTASATPSPQPSPTPTSTARPAHTLMPRPSQTPLPTPTASTTPAPPTATATSTPEPTPTPTLPVHDVAYVADVTIPDGTVIEPGTPFTKTWRLRNTGNAPWEGTSLMLVVGEAMGGPDAVPVPATAPGETADVSVPMVAPAATGEHSAAWRLCRAEGCFGGAVTLQIVSRPALAARGPAVELPPAEPVACNYIGNRNPTSMKLHRADCRWVQEMYEGNKVCFATREEAIAAGYVPCKVCKP